MQIVDQSVDVLCGDAEVLYSKELRSILSKSERERADQMVSSLQQKTYITCRAYLRIILGQWLNLEPGELSFTYNGKGKPQLEFEDVFFNVSHAVETFVIAITRIGKIGIDIEKSDRYVDFERLKALIFSDAEIDGFSMIKKEDQRVAFLNAWTRKEAFFKAVGSGLSSPLKELNVSFDLYSAPRVLFTGWSETEKDRWKLIHISDIQQITGAIAIESEGLSPQCNYLKL